MNLDRPLCTLDCETTGTDPVADRIITFYACRDFPSGDFDELDLKFNPEKEITPENQEIHGISNSDVKDWPKFDAAAGREILQFIDGCVLSGFNILGFDAQIIHESLERVGVHWDVNSATIVDAGALFKVMEPRGLDAAVPFYCKRKHEGAHGAKADALATRDVFFAQINRYENLMEMSAEQIADFCRTNKDGTKRLDLAGTIMLSKAGVPVFGTKRNRGVPLTQDIGYCGWIQRSDFPRSTKQVIEKVLSQKDDELPFQ